MSMESPNHERTKVENEPADGPELAATIGKVRIAAGFVAIGSLLSTAAVGFSLFIAAGSVYVGNKPVGRESLFYGLLVAAAGALLIAVGKIPYVTNGRHLGNHLYCLIALLLDGSGIVVPLQLVSRKAPPMLCAWISLVCMLTSSIMFTYYLRSVATTIGDTKLGSSTRAAIICMWAFVVSVVGQLLTVLTFSTTSYGIGNNVALCFLTGAIFAGPAGLLAYIALLVAFALREPPAGNVWKISMLDLSDRPVTEAADHLGN